VCVLCQVTNERVFRRLQQKQEYQMEALWTNWFLLYDKYTCILAIGGQKVSCPAKCDDFGASNIFPGFYAASVTKKCSVSVTICKCW
jgi:hypothetical protein